MLIRCHLPYFATLRHVHILIAITIGVFERCAVAIVTTQISHTAAALFKVGRSLGHVDAFYNGTLTGAERPVNVSHYRMASGENVILRFGSCVIERGRDFVIFVAL